MEELIKYLPAEINTAFLLAFLLLLYKIFILVNEKIKKNKESKKEFEKEIVNKEKKKSEFEQRVNKLEQDVISIRRDFKEKNAENKEDFVNLSNKIDKILDILLQPAKR